MVKTYVWKNKGYRYEVEVSMDVRGNVVFTQPDRVAGGFIFLYPKQARCVVAALQKEFDKRDHRRHGYRRRLVLHQAGRHPDGTEGRRSDAGGGGRARRRHRPDRDSGRPGRRFRQLVWIKAKIFRHTCVGYTVKANGGDIAGYVATDKLKRRGREKQ